VVAAENGPFRAIASRSPRRLDMPGRGTKAVESSAKEQDGRDGPQSAVEHEQEQRGSGLDGVRCARAPVRHTRCPFPELSWRVALRRVAYPRREPNALADPFFSAETRRFTITTRASCSPL
jgi:hypothetical protein